VARRRCENRTHRARGLEAIPVICNDDCIAGFHVRAYGSHEDEYPKLKPIVLI